MKKELKKNDPFEKDAVALSDDLLEQVAGGENPFGEIPRVPEQPIDPELRQDG